MERKKERKKERKRKTPAHLARIAAGDELGLDAGDVLEGLLETEGGDPVEGLQVAPVHQVLLHTLQGVRLPRRAAL